METVTVRGNDPKYRDLGLGGLVWELGTLGGFGDSGASGFKITALFAWDRDPIIEPYGSLQGDPIIEPYSSLNGYGGAMSRFLFAMSCGVVTA